MKFTCNTLYDRVIIEGWGTGQTSCDVPSIGITWLFRNHSIPHGYPNDFNCNGTDDFWFEDRKSLEEGKCSSQVSSDMHIVPGVCTYLNEKEDYRLSVKKCPPPSPSPSPPARSVDFTKKGALSSFRSLRTPAIVMVTNMLRLLSAKEDLVTMRTLRKPLQRLKRVEEVHWIQPLGLLNALTAILRVVRIYWTILVNLSL